MWIILCLFIVIRLFQLRQFEIYSVVGMNFIVSVWVGLFIDKRILRVVIVIFFNQRFILDQACINSMRVWIKLTPNQIDKRIVLIAIQMNVKQFGI